MTPRTPKTPRLALTLLALLISAGASTAHAQDFTATITKVMCLKPATGIERGVVRTLRVFTRIADGAVSTIGPVVGLGGPKAQVALAATEASIAAVQAGTDIASAIDGRRSPDQLYIKSAGSKIWPGGKYATLRGGATANVGAALRPIGANTFHARLMEYDSGSGDDDLGSFRFTARKAGKMTVQVHSKQEDSAYLVEVDVKRIGSAGPSPLPGGKITLLGAHGKYVVAENDGKANANRKHANTWETWTVQHNANGTVSLRSYHGLYLVAESNGAANANRSKASHWEQWTPIKHADGSVSLRSHHGLYLVAEADGGLNANRSQIGAWERFKLARR